MSHINLSHPTRIVKADITLPGSKSESNRALILNALTGGKLALNNLSNARDTQQLIKLLASDDETIDVIDAGTSMRFLTAYYCATNQHKIITGTPRMQQRPIAPLVNALSEMGFDVRYLGEEGFPPLEIVPIKSLERLDDEVYIEGNVSSQFITALLLIAPFLPNGLRVNFTTHLASKPYIDMTLTMLECLGVKHVWQGDSVQISHVAIEPREINIGADWSAASYWYSIAFLADEAEITLRGLQDDYTQGDRVVADWMKRFGVLTQFTAEGAVLTKTKVEYPMVMKLNFKDNPDLAQTFAAMFAAKNIICTFSGLDSLKIKETDRVLALQQELRKIGVRFDYSDMYEFYQLKGTYTPSTKPFATYSDHRMAMAFAPLALLGEISLDDASVIDKSYPSFWQHLTQAGFVVSA